MMVAGIKPGQEQLVTARTSLVTSSLPAGELWVRLDRRGMVLSPNSGHFLYGKVNRKNKDYKRPSLSPA